VVHSAEQACEAGWVREGVDEDRSVNEWMRLVQMGVMGRTYGYKHLKKKSSTEVVLKTNLLECWMPVVTHVSLVGKKIVILGTKVVNKIQKRKKFHQS
jgi:hypothetical protein